MIARRGWGRGRPAPEPTGERFDPAAADVVLRRVVRPVVASLVRPDELEQLAVGRVPGYPAQPALLVSLRARGESWSQVIWQEGMPERTIKEVAVHLGDQLEDWICLTRFAWGERRRACVDVAP